MARYTGADCVLCRREGMKLFLKGTKCSTNKCPFEKKGYAPGQHGRTRRFKQSEYSVQLREKQKVKRIYGLLEKQFSNYFKKAEKQLRKLRTYLGRVTRDIERKISQMPQLQQELLAVIRKYVNVGQDAITVNFEQDGNQETLELNIVLPDDR